MTMTAVIIIVFTILILATDVWLIVKKGINGTISMEIIQDSHKYPIIAFLWGFLMGHFYG